MKRKMFARMLKTDGVTKCLEMLSEAAGRKIEVDLKAEFFEVKAPDGDVVFAGLKKSKDVWVCRLHREVFAE
jgi:hypothetical protein